ncbi:type 1 fimbrial major subunit FimA [Escherichia coli]|uniref:type 1 fimbrial major subunit FimA n=1 Tax=Escherichia coli TaxID=562 RepID=UPI001CF32DE3|nr:type 1 fimbrial major subunit FimA [Escherichia coli]MCA8743661.1 type 1 fimbrial major subunit FimA [Escherichia coli]MCA8828796.1 type 1 fimbrial major subunit FimA [Escherichia coli]HBB6573011.1 type 1 fimbrial major subunit FimA [Escherichia coli]
MKLKFISMAVFSALTLGVATSASAATVNGGTVHFKGEVVDAACAVSLNSFDQTVNLGQVRAAKLANDADKSAPVGFDIELSDCSTLTSANAAIIFTGNQPAGHNDILAVQGGAGTATNVGVQVTDYTGKAVIFDGSTASTNYKLTDGTNKIPFQARYIAVGGAAGAGTANADATFKVQYQ